MRSVNLTSVLEPPSVDTFGLAVDAGAESLGPALGVWDVWYHAFHFQTILQWRAIHPFSTGFRKKDAVLPLKGVYGGFAKYLKDFLAKRDLARKKDPLLYFSGDHSGAIPFWGTLLDEQESMGLIWIDAHMDAHTPKTSHTQNLHGMPLAYLLGAGEAPLSELIPKAIDPRSLCLVGVRSYEPEEEALLRSLGVKIYYANEVIGRETDVMKEAIAHVMAHSNSFGISLDIDALEPREAPGTNCHIPNGLHPLPMLAAFQALRGHSGFVGLEISEYTPAKDPEKKTLQHIIQLVAALFGKTEENKPSLAKDFKAHMREATGKS